jgi:hypothetical protein
VCRVWDTNPIFSHHSTLGVDVAKLDTYCEKDGVSTTIQRLYSKSKLGMSPVIVDADGWDVDIVCLKKGASAVLVFVVPQRPVMRFVLCASSRNPCSAVLSLYLFVCNATALPVRMRAFLVLIHGARFRPRSRSSALHRSLRSAYR